VVGKAENIAGVPVSLIGAFSYLASRASAVHHLFVNKIYTAIGSLSMTLLRRRLILYKT
jgi:hypothetical protein